MSGLVSTEVAVQDMSRLARLGHPTAEPLALRPIPLKHFAGSIFLLLIGLLALGGVYFLPVDIEQHVRVIVVIVGLVVIARGGVILYRNFMEHARVALFENGLTLSRFGRERTLLFEEIRSVSFQAKELLDNGAREGWLGRWSVETAATRIRFSHLVLGSTADSLEPALLKLLDSLVDRAEATLRAGSTLSGRRWTLDASGLRSGATAPVPLSAITSVGTFSGRVSIWRDGEERPFLAMPSASPNAVLLLHLLQRRLAAKPQREAEGLGRMLFEKRPGIVEWMIVALLGGFLILGGVLGGVALLTNGHVWGGLLTLGFGLLPLAGLKYTEKSVACHERGVVRRFFLGRERSLRFEDVDRLTYKATAIYYNGAYAGTDVRLTLASEQGDPICFRRHVKGSDTDLDELRDGVATTVAARLKERLTRDDSVAWTKAARLSKAGVHYRRKKLAGSGEEAFAPFDLGLRYSIDRGTFHLMLPGETKPALDLSCDGENFYPGFLLFLMLAAEAAPSQGAISA